ncbi:MAG: hypothetical protein OXF27_10845, partial [Acidobacteria bacterium]|nr:hypothetical protein [Acidobacteriota bacterium]
MLDAGIRRFAGSISPYGDDAARSLVQDLQREKLQHQVNYERGRAPRAEELHDLDVRDREQRFRHNEALHGPEVARLIEAVETQKSQTGLYDAKTGVEDARRAGLLQTQTDQQMMAELERQRYGGVTPHKISRASREADLVSQEIDTESRLGGYHDARTGAVNRAANDAGLMEGLKRGRYELLTPLVTGRAQSEIDKLMQQIDTESARGAGVRQGTSDAAAMAAAELDRFNQLTPHEIDEALAAVALGRGKVDTEGARGDLIRQRQSDDAAMSGLERDRYGAITPHEIAGAESAVDLLLQEIDTEGERGNYQRARTAGERQSTADDAAIAGMERDRYGAITPHATAEALADADLSELKRSRYALETPIVLDGRYADVDKTLAEISATNADEALTDARRAGVEQTVANDHAMAQAELGRYSQMTPHKVAGAEADVDATLALVGQRDAAAELARGRLANLGASGGGQNAPLVTVEEMTEVSEYLNNLALVQPELADPEIAGAILDRVHDLMLEDRVEAKAIGRPYKTTNQLIREAMAPPEPDPNAPPMAAEPSGPGFWDRVGNFFGGSPDQAPAAGQPTFGYPVNPWDRAHRQLPPGIAPGAPPAAAPPAGRDP